MKILVASYIPNNTLIDNEISLNNAWFSGFFDGNGYSSIRNKYSLT